MVFDGGYIMRTMGLVLCGLFLIGAARADHGPDDGEPAHNVVVARQPRERSDMGATTIRLDGNTAMYSQLQHEGRIGGPQFGWEIWATNVEAGVLIAPRVIRYNNQGQPQVYWTAKTLQFHVDAKRSEFFINMTDGFGYWADGSTGLFSYKVWTWPLPHADNR
jgi:hypothetical protein